eukprot:2129969-Prymnesium_polylepis.1
MHDPLRERFVSDEETDDDKTAGTASLRSRLWRRMGLSYPTVSQFLGNTLTYVLSRQWIDLFATSLTHLHPLPFCSADDSHLPCTPEAPALDQAAFAGVVLLAALVVQRLCNANAHRWPSLARVPQMARMCAGWAFGGAS